jgi:hypothetical protein
VVTLPRLFDVARLLVEEDGLLLLDKGELPFFGDLEVDGEDAAEEYVALLRLLLEDATEAEADADKEPRDPLMRLDESPSASPRSSPSKSKSPWSLSSKSNSSFIIMIHAVCDCM